MTTLPVTFDHDELVKALKHIEPRLCILLAFATAEPISRTVILGAAVEAHHEDNITNQLPRRVK